jgi:hypothetical protein
VRPCAVIRVRFSKFNAICGRYRVLGKAAEPEPGQEQPVQAASRHVQALRADQIVGRVSASPTPDSLIQPMPELSRRFVMQPMSKDNHKC